MLPFLNRTKPTISPLSSNLSLRLRVGSLQLESGKLERLLHESTLMADSDLLLANAIKGSKAKVLLGDFSHTSQQGVGYEIERETINAHIVQISDPDTP